MRRRILAASILMALAGCSSGSSPPATPTSGAPASAAGRPAAATTVPRPTTQPPRTTTQPSRTTSARSATSAATGETTTNASGPVTTNVPAGPCDAALLLAAAQAAFGPLPEGSAATDPRCVENYATAVLTAPGQDNALAVFNNPEGEWIGRNIGTDQVCSAADVPLDFFEPLGCGPWEG